MDTAGRTRAAERAELEGRMVPGADVIRRKEVGSLKVRSTIDDKEVMHEV